MRWIIWINLAVAAALVSGCGKGSVDLSTPKAAVLAFGHAMEVGDAETAKAATVEGDPKLIEALANSASSRKRLHDAAVAKFGAEGSAFAAEGETSQVDYAKVLADSDVAIDGDTATMTGKSDTSTPLKLKKVGNDWKVDVTSIVGMSDASSMIPAMQAMNAANDELAADIAAGKYASAADASKARSQKLTGILAGQAGAGDGK